MGVLDFVGSVVPPLISGAASYYGQQQTNSSNAFQAMYATDASIADAQRNREFQERMSGSAYQRAVEDMRKAGLNPALAYQQGGASAPSGSAGSGQQAHMENSLGAGVSSAQRTADMVARIESLQQQRAQSAASVTESLSRADLTAAQAQQVRMMTVPGLRESVARTGLANESATRQKYEASFLANSMPQRTALMEAQWSSAMASAAASRAMVPLREGQKTLLDLSIPRMRNEAGAANTWWGQKVSPFLGDAKSVSNILTPWVPR